jgi:hypothetical protein
LSISNLVHVILDFHTIKNGPEVVLDAVLPGGVAQLKMMSPFDYPTLILSRSSVGIFFLSLIIQKLFEFIDVAGNWPLSSKIWVFWGF